jgi:hypothetical protein
MITAGALNLASHPDFPLHLLLDGQPPARFNQGHIVVGRHAVLTSTAECTEESSVLIIGPGSQGFFDRVSKDERRVLFDRCLRIALRGNDDRIALNPAWMPFRKGNRVSLFAHSWSTLRVIAETNFENSGNTYIFDLIANKDARDLTTLPINSKPYQLAVEEFGELLARRERTGAQDASKVDLEQIEGNLISRGMNYDQWFSRLSKRQREFVERPVSGPLRVRGAAGTGKTLAMVMRALRIVKDAKEGEEPRVLFLTHSWAMANQVDDMVRSIGRDIPRAAFIEVFPLLGISGERDYGSIGREPLGTDSDEGKRRTLDIISSLLDDFVASDWIAYKGGATPEFVVALEAPRGSPERRRFAWDLMIEFGCVLAAQGLLGRATDRERYMRTRRVGYMMPLANAQEKEVVFRLWIAFLAHLKEFGLISSDQIVCDYLNELQTFFWEAARAARGWDVIFVDEMHLFNAQERLIFHNLLKDGDRTPLVMMALDPKQSPRQVYTEVSDEKDDKTPGIYERARLPNPDKVDLVEVYRYTAQIADLIKGVIDAAPALDMNDDWNLPAGVSTVGAGPKPSFHLEADATRVFRRSMELATSLQTEARGRGGQVAVLCLDYERFNTYYLAAEGQHSREAFVIRSRDDINKLRYMNRRIVFSMPEYVAGLQFDTVILADANANLVPDGAYRGHSERNFLSELYLGISRAERRLEIVASKDCDGLSPYLRTLADQGLLLKA